MRSPEIDQMATECLLGHARVITRRLNKRYDEALRPFGLQASQFNLLTAIGYAGPLRRSQIADVLYLEPSTLTRNLRIMLTKGWIGEVQDVDDRRAKQVEITKIGRDLLVAVLPAWRSAQTDAGDFLGVEGQALVQRLSRRAQIVPTQERNTGSN